MTAFQLFGAIFIGSCGLVAGGFMLRDLYTHRDEIIRALGL